MTTTVTPPARREVLVVLPGLLLAMLLAMLDQMIVGTAMPRIVGELGGLDHLSWVVTAYVLMSTVSTPLYGKLGDLYGRKRLFVGAIVIFLVGSALSGMAQSMVQLIGFRALQGLGAGGLIVGVMAIIGDLIPPRERGRYQGYMSATMAAATICGPLLGGFLTDHFSWRWAFYVNLPVGVLALVLVGTTLHLPRHRISHRIDYLGAALLTVAATSLVLVTTWGGTQYAWGSAQILGLAALGVVSAAGFVVAERRAAEPVLPLRLFRDRNFTAATLMGFLVGFAMFGAVTFLPLFQQTVQGASATNSGLLLLPMMAASLVVSLVVGTVITRTGRYRAFPIAGGAMLTVGVFALSLMDTGTTKLTLSVYMVILGIGMGLLMQVTLLIVQNSVEAKDMGVASSTSTFARSIGGSFGVSLFGAIFASRLTHSLAGMPGADRLTGGGGAHIDPATLHQLPAAARDTVLTAIADGMHSVFLWAAPFALAAFAIGWAIKAVPLRGGPGQVSPAGPAGPEGEAIPADSPS
ncbi:MDR family MFS transporter [Actinopolymorpha singaporensis]|uniref:Drug resistance transporter, EmrB/QacA subfamily n=1 Tax=Actinopolymorpha singaporensis TaxID=117157 RepID=A0A1H1LZX4_9ACTN|nr:MDR family MFS transporter [Actinopolymorpha singaporensis]SDR79950.1 drug resistance transporter, EmrB/QacA subfamily [Actinopolymorpha singaporensis]